MEPEQTPAAPGIAPMVAIVGRPNVGKSTLFNRLVGRRQAIVHDQPGVTRDRITARVELQGDAVGESGRVFELVDTGGLVPDEDPLGLNQQVRLAVEESDILLLLVDGRQGPVTGDERVWEELRRSGKPAILVVNKADTREAAAGFDEFYRLGLPRQVLVSAEHGLGLGELVDAVLEVAQEHLPAAQDAPAVEAPAVAVVGRPNVGKSSILNRLLGQERSLVSPIAGTTRDPVDTLIELDGERTGERYLFIDTAGIRRRSQVSGAAEELAVMMARRQIERADLAILVVDAAAGVTSGDLAIAGSIWELGRAAIVVVNKWDLLDPDARERLEESWDRIDDLLASPRRVNISALTGRGLEKIFPMLAPTLEDFRLELSTAELNRLLEEAVRRTKAPAHRGRAWKLYYATQVGTGPPTFMLFANRILARSDSYRRYLTNRLRQTLGLPGVPLRLVIRKRGGKPGGRPSGKS